MSAPLCVELTEDEALRLLAAIVYWWAECPCTCPACPVLNRAMQEVLFKKLQAALP